MSQKFRQGELNRLYYNEFFPKFNDYTIISKEVKRKTVTKPLPFHTDCAKKGEYLADYADFYMTDEYYATVLKPQYQPKENRPTYSVEVEVATLEIELTDSGRAKVQERYSKYLKLFNDYAKFIKFIDD